MKDDPLRQCQDPHEKAQTLCDKDLGPWASWDNDNDVGQNMSKHLVASRMTGLQPNLNSSLCDLCGFDHRIFTPQHTIPKSPRGRCGHRIKHQTDAPRHDS